MPVTEQQEKYLHFRQTKGEPDHIARKLAGMDPLPLKVLKDRSELLAKQLATAKKFKKLDDVPIIESEIAINDAAIADQEQPKAKTRKKAAAKPPVEPKADPAPTPAPQGAPVVPPPAE